MAIITGGTTYESLAEAQKAITDSGESAMLNISGGEVISGKIYEESSPGAGIIWNVDGATFSHNEANAGGGGAVKVTEDNSTFNNVLFYGNTSWAGDGGAMLISADTVISGSTFTSNRAFINAANSGGAIRVLNGANVTITDTDIINNRTGHVGAGIRFNGSILTLANVKIDGNASERTTQGQGIWMDSGEIHVTGLLTLGYKQEVSGGKTIVVGSGFLTDDKLEAKKAIDAYDATILAKTTVSVDNAEKYKIITWNNDVYVYNGDHFAEVIVSASGATGATDAKTGETYSAVAGVKDVAGAITAGDAIIIDGVNHAGRFKLGSGAKTFTGINGASFSGNTISGLESWGDFDGAVANVYAGNHTFKNFIFADNNNHDNATACNGGGVFMVNGGALSIDGSTFTGNTSRGGGAISQVGGTLSVTNSYFYNNHGDGRGGAIFSKKSNITLGNLYFEDNSTDAYGSAYCIDGDSTLTLVGKLTLGAGQTGRIDKDYTVVTANFINGENQLAKVIDGDANTAWRLGTGNAVADAEGFSTFIGADTDVYVTNCKNIVTADALVTKSSNGAFAIGDTVYTAAKMYDDVNAALAASSSVIVDGEFDISRIDATGTKTITGINNAAFAGKTVDGTGLAWSNNDGNALFMNNAAANWTINNITFSGNTFVAGESNGGGAVAVMSGLITLNGCTFADNSTGGDGGAFHYRGANGVVTDTLFVNNYSGNRGSAIHNRGTLTLSGVTFAANHGVEHAQNRSALYSLGTIRVAGTIYLGDQQNIYSSTDIIVLGDSFITADGGVQAAKVFDGSVGTSIFTGSGAVLDDSTKYKFFNAGTNDIYITQIDSTLATAAIVSADGAGACVVDGVVYYGAAAASVAAAMQGAEDNLILMDYSIASGDNFDGSKNLMVFGDVNFANTESVVFNADLSKYNVTVSGLGYGKHVIATDVDALGSTVTVDGNVLTIGESAVVGTDLYLAEFADEVFTVTKSEIAKSDYVAFNPDWAGKQPGSVVGSMTIGGKTADLVIGINAFDSLDGAKSMLNAGGTVVLHGYTATGYLVQGVNKLYAQNLDLGAGVLNLKTVNQNASELTVENSTMLAVRAYDWNSSYTWESFKFTMINSTVTNMDLFYANTTNDYDLVLDNVTLCDVQRLMGGGNIGGNYNMTLKNSVVGSVIFVKGLVGGDLNANVENTQVTGSLSMCANDFTGVQLQNVNYTITNSYIADGISGGGSSDKPVVDGDVTINLIGSTAAGYLDEEGYVAGGVIGTSKNDVEGDIFVNLSGSTAFYIMKKGGKTDYITADMTLTVKAHEDATVIQHGFSGLDYLVMESGAELIFESAQDLSKVFVTVDAAGLQNGDTVISGVSKIGGYEILNSNAGAALTVVDGNLIISTATFTDGMVKDGNFVNETNSSLITGGTVTGAFVGTSFNTGNVTTEIQGGTFQKFAVGGALVKNAAETASMGKVEVTISGGEFADRIYGAGYAYGSDADTELHVAKSEVVLSGGTVNDGVFGGAHARKNAHVLVDAVDINISGGTFKDIFGGGWAERNSVSTVTSATIDMSAGFAKYIFAGGANSSDSASINGSEAAAASGDTDPAVAISLTGSADADYIFLSSKHANSKVYGDVTLTISDCDSDKGFEFTRISGMAGCGVDNTSGTTKVVLESDLSLKY
ncbi:MAG: hypothetical protein IKA71_02240, partial [Lentisphaeria bacterium]|nr:hypothetical protein [Lentisphaeria bacterium]